MATVQPHYNTPHCSAVFNKTRPITIIMRYVQLLHGSPITRPVSMDPKGRVITRLNCNSYDSLHHPDRDGVSVQSS